MEHEAAFIRSFVLPEKQSRWSELLLNPRRREVFLHRLADASDLNTKFKVSIPPSQQTVEGIQGLLRRRGAPGRCHVISESIDIDGKELSLGEALAEVLGQGMGSILSCIPGKLAYYEGEMPSDRYILEKQGRA